MCGYSQCYRSEIGSYGKETKGMYRVHEFMKVEQVVITDADVEKANKMQDEMTAFLGKCTKNWDCRIGVCRSARAT